MNHLNTPEEVAAFVMAGENDPAGDMERLVATAVRWGVVRGLVRGWFFGLFTGIFGTAALILAALTALNLAK